MFGGNTYRIEPGLPIGLQLIFDISVLSYQPTSIVPRSTTSSFETFITRLSWWVMDPMTPWSRNLPPLPSSPCGDKREPILY